MHTTDRVWAIFWVSLFFTITIIVSTAFYNARVNAPIEAPLRMQQQQLEAAQDTLKIRERMFCIQRQGTWAGIDGDARNGLGCKFN
jgi:hypothetical protein